jgi:hypothetical protein
MRLAANIKATPLRVTDPIFYHPYKIKKPATGIPAAGLKVLYFLVTLY